MSNGSLNKGSIVKGSGGSGGGGSSATLNFFDGVTGTTLDTQLTLGNAVMVFKNGVLLQATADYTISGSTITFITSLENGDKIAVINGNLTAIDLSGYKQKAETIEIDTATITIANIQPNKNYVFTNNAITDITLTACETSMEETTIQFTTGTSAPTLTDNSGLVWFGGIPTLLPNTTYVIVIFNKQAFYQEN